MIYKLNNCKIIIYNTMIISGYTYYIHGRPQGGTFAPLEKGLGMPMIIYNICI